MSSSSELDRIRAITNMTPAPVPEDAPPMRCPACGQVVDTEGRCKNEDCESYEQD